MNKWNGYVFTTSLNCVALCPAYRKSRFARSMVNGLSRFTVNPKPGPGEAAVGSK
jgi:hypothetical protein